MKKLFLALAAAAVCMAFSGCTVFETDTEALMKPPVFTEEQEKLNAALSEVIGGSYILKYPQNGDMNSAFIFKDLDGDGEEEVLAFYSLMDESTRINVLKKEGEGWLSVYEAAGYSGDIEKIDFARMDEKGEVILVEWEQEAAVYRYENERLVTIHRASCDGTDIADINGDGFYDIIVFGSSLSGRSVINVLYGSGNEVTASEEITINAEYGKIYSAGAGGFYEGKNAYFIDSEIYDGVYLTEMIVMEKEAVVYRFENDKTVELYRTECGGIEIADTNGDELEEIVLLGSGSLEEGVLNFAFSEYGEASAVKNDVLDEKNTYSVVTGKLDDGRKAYFVESSVYGENDGVKISVVEEETVRRYFVADIVEDESEEKPKDETSSVIVVVGGDYGKRGIFLRNTKVYCMDTNGDGIIEVPVEFREDYAQSASDKIFFMQYMQYDGTVCETVWNGVANTENGYLFALPESWNTKTKVSVISSGDVMTFVSAATGEEILSIRAVLKNDYQDKYEEFILGAEDETKNYYIKISAEPGSEFYIAPEELENCFIFI